MEILIKQLSEQAKLPSYAHATDPGISLYSNEEVVLSAGQRVSIGTGVALAIPVGYIGLIWHKDGISEADGLTVEPVVVDSGYRKEVRVELVNNGSEDYTVESRDCVAQMLIQKIEQPRLIEAEDLSEAAEESEG